MTAFPFDHLTLAEVAEYERLTRKLREQPSRWTAADRRRRSSLRARRSIEDLAREAGTGIA